MADLAQKPSKNPVGASEPSKPSYPTLTLRDDQVDKVKGEHECNVDDIYDAYVRLKVTGISNDEFGQRLEFAVTNMDEFTPAEGGGEPEEEAEVEEKEEPAAEGKAKKPPKALTYS